MRLVDLDISLSSFEFKIESIERFVYCLAPQEESKLLLTFDVNDTSPSPALEVVGVCEDTSTCFSSDTISTSRLADDEGRYHRLCRTFPSKYSWEPRKPGELLRSPSSRARWRLVELLPLGRRSVLASGKHFGVVVGL